MVPPGVGERSTSNATPGPAAWPRRGRGPGRLTGRGGPAPGDVLGDVLGVAPDAADQHRSERVEELAGRRSRGPGSAGTTPRSCSGHPSLAEDRQVDPAESPAEAGAPDRRWRRRATRPSSSTGLPVAHARDRAATRSTPAAARSLGLTRMQRLAVPRGPSAAPCGRSACRIVSTCVARRTTAAGRRSRARRPSMSNGICAGVPARTARSMARRATSSAMSAPELPAPTTSTAPSRSCDGLR